MDVEHFKEDVRSVRIDGDRLVELIVRSQHELQHAKQELDEAKRPIEELEKKLGGSGTAKTAKPFSVKSEERRQEARGKQKPKRNKSQRRGRIKTSDKVAQAARTEKAFPAGVPEEDCGLSHTRVAWRLENGQAVLVAYEVYRGPKNQYDQISGVLGRSEIEIEIVLAIAYQVCVVGLSFDKVCLLMNLFQNLRLRKSQADALLNRLSRHWEQEFYLLCTLLANALVVHKDETSWSRPPFCGGARSVWAFLSEKARLLFWASTRTPTQCLRDRHQFLAFRTIAWQNTGSAGCQSLCRHSHCAVAFGKETGNEAIHQSLHSRPTKSTHIDSCISIRWERFSMVLILLLNRTHSKRQF